MVGSSELPHQINRGEHFRSNCIINLDSHGHVVLVIANAALGDGLAELFFQQHRVGGHLQSIAWPCDGCLVSLPFASPFFVFVGDPVAIADSSGVDFAEKPERVGGDFKGSQLSRIIVEFRNAFFVQSPAGVNAVIGFVQAFDFFQVKKTLAIKQSVQRHHPDRRFVLILSCFHGNPSKRLRRFSVLMHDGITSRLSSVWAGSTVSVRHRVVRTLHRPVAPVRFVFRPIRHGRPRPAK